METIWQSGELTREDILNAVFCSLDDAIGELESGGLIAIEAAPNRETHLDVFRVAKPARQALSA